MSGSPGARFLCGSDLHEQYDLRGPCLRSGTASMSTSSSKGPRRFKSRCGRDGGGHRNGSMLERGCAVRSMDGGARPRTSPRRVSHLAADSLYLLKLPLFRMSAFAMHSQH